QSGSGGAAWNLEARIGPTPANSYKQFGAATAIDGDVCIIGAPAENTGLVSAGAAYIFRRVGGTWTQEAHLTAPDAQAGDQFGTTCAISGDLAVLGAPFKSDIAVQVGAAYIYERVGGVWSAGTRIDMNDGMDAAFFGSALACAPGIVIVGAANKSTVAGSE